MSDRAGAERRIQELASELDERSVETDELEKERARLEAVVEQMPVGVVVVEAPGGAVISINEEAVRLVGGTASVTERDARRLDGSAYPEEGLPLARALSGENVAPERIELTVPSGERKTVDVSAAPVIDRAGRTVSAVAIIRDATEGARRERAERDFVTNAAHELQSPLAAITSAIEVLQAGAKDAAERDLFLEHIERESQRLARLVRSLLTLARVQTGAEAPRSELIELRPLLDSIAGRMAPAGGVSVAVECPDDVAVLANRELLDQALVNIARNADKYTDKGSIVLGAHVENGRVAITVSDTGIGIDHDLLPQVFDRFVRADSGREGFGLGLAIVREAVDVLGGELTVDSTPGEGTTVRIGLPSGATVVTR